MNNTKKSLKVLFIGESWHIHMIHSKGYDSFTSSKYEEGATWLLQCLKNSQVDVTYMPAHTVQIAFPEDVAQLEQYDAIVISDIGSNTFLLQNDTFYQLRIWICPYISRHLLSLNPLQARCRRYSRGER